MTASSSTRKLILPRAILSKIRKQHHTIYKNTKYVTTTSFHLKTKRLELEHGKQKNVKRGHNIDDPGCFPVPLFCSNEIDWKISLESYNKTDGFAIKFNDVEFKDLPYQSEIIQSGAQNINYGLIKMNGIEILRGFKAYSNLKNCMPDYSKVVDLEIGGTPGKLFETTSADVAN